MIATTAVVLMLPAILSPGSLGSQVLCPTVGTPGSWLPPATWSAPLDRVVSLSLQDLPMQQALDRLSTQSGVRLTYSRDLLPLDSEICLAATGITLGDALLRLFPSNTVNLIVAGSDHVVLAPVRSAIHTASPEPEVIHLERVVVTGSPGGAADRQTAYALEVIDGDRLRRLGGGSLGEALNALVPGIWTWSGSSAGDGQQTRFGSVRGSSSFGATFPKIYLDGIEVANPLLLAHLSAESVERLEVIRGPQGSALYGSDAISGVINIVTRRDPADGREPDFELQSSAGLVDSDFATRNVVSQNHMLTMRAGDSFRWARLAVGVGSSGEIVPGGGSRYLTSNGTVRVAGYGSLLTGTARLHLERSGIAAAPVSGGLFSPGGMGQETGMSMMTRTLDSSQYTLGGTLKILSDARWTHSLIGGIDGYRTSRPFHDFDESGSAIVPPFDPSASAHRLTIRTSSVAQLPSVDGVHGSLTLGAEQSLLRQAVETMTSTAWPGTLPSVQRLTTSRWESATGVLARADASLRETFFLSAGLRVERNGALTGLAVLPLLGASAVSELGGWEGKLRAAYGKGIRPVRFDGLPPGGSRVGMIGLASGPEVQTGIEMGLDLRFGEAFGLAITRFDQLATNLVQPVALQLRTAGGGMGPKPVVRGFQALGEIGNRGWEGQISTSLADRLSVAASVATVDSRVTAIAPGYTGDLRPGDRMLEVPSRTATINGTWLQERWSASLNLNRAWDWINYDRQRLMADGTAAMAGSAPSGESMRGYWRVYSGITHVDASATLQLSPGFGVRVTAQNVLDRQIGEPDNATIRPGRTLGLGFQAAL